MSGPNDPIPSHEIDRVTRQPGSGSSTDDAAGFVDGAQVEVPRPVMPPSPVVAVQPPESAESKLDRLGKLIDRIPEAAMRINQGEDFVAVLERILETVLLIPERCGGSVLPMVVEDEKGEVCEVTLVHSISGGADEVDDMPRQLHLLRWSRGESRTATYEQVPR